MRPDPVVYQIYPRSFQDSDGDGVGDLDGIRARLDHLAWLGVDALWLSPIYPSPMADFGYDVSDYTGVDPVFGALDDFDALRRRGRTSAGWRCCSTSCPATPRSSTRGSASIRTGTSGPDEPRTTGRRPSAGRAWRAARRPLLPPLLLSRAAGSRLAQPGGRGGHAGRAALLARPRRRRLPPRRDRPAAEGPAAARRPAGQPSRSGCRCARTRRSSRSRHSRNAPGHRRGARARCARRRATRFLVGEVYLPSARWQPYLDHFDAVFAFELLHAPWDADALRAAIDGARVGRGAAAWVMSEPRLRAPGHALRRRERARRGAAAAHAAGHRPSSIRATRSASATARRASATTTAPGATASATRCSGTPRRRRVHDGRAVASAGRPRRAQRRRPARRPGLDALPRARPDRAATRSSGGDFELLDDAPRRWSRSGAGTTSWRSTPDRSAARRRSGRARARHGGRRGRRWRPSAPQRRGVAGFARVTEGVDAPQ